MNRTPNEDRPGRRRVLTAIAGVPFAVGLDWRSQEPVQEGEDWRAIRARFPLTTDRTYLNSGGLGPSPYSVLNAVVDTMRRLQRISETGHRHIVEALAPVARFLGASPEEVSFTRNATEGNATIASGLRLERGDEVVFESHAHPGGAIPWMSRAKRDGIVVKIFEPSSTSAQENIDRIQAIMTPRTRVLQVSHLTAPTGIRMPLDALSELSKSRGVWFHVDGAQSAGMIPVDLHHTGCDSYATSGHKWLGGPHGTGILYIRRDRLDDVAPTESGAYSNAAYELPDLLEYVDEATRHQAGTRDAATIVGLQRAVEFMDSIGMERVAAYGAELSEHLHEGLSKIPEVTILTPSDPALRGAITTFKIDGISYRDLDTYFRRTFGLRCRIVSERGLDALRVSLHIYNNHAECDRIVEATRSAIRELRSR